MWLEGCRGLSAPPFAPALPVVAAILAAAGCATQAQREYVRMQQAAQTANANLKACVDGVHGSDVYARLNKVLILNENDPQAPEKMSIDRVATDAEKKDVLALHALMQKCRARALQDFGAIHPAYVALLAKWFSENDEEAAPLLQGKQTFGQINTITNRRLPVRRQEIMKVRRQHYEHPSGRESE